MDFGIIKKPTAILYETAAVTKRTGYGTISAIADEALHGMLMAVTGEPVRGFVPVKTFYGYTGYLPADEMLPLDEAGAEAWERSDLMVVGGFCVDVVSIPRVQGVRLISLYRGALIQVLEFESETAGWARVALADGRVGYMRNQYLWKKKFSQAGTWTGGLPQREITDEAAFRQSVTDTALTYLGTQYRWGGRCTAGIDCSGLTSISYMMSGILLYRDAKIVRGYPVHQIPKDAVQKGDLLYFPGHIAMYLGEGNYIHSTGKVGSGGVVINSLNPRSDSFRQDLLDSLYAVGSIF